MLRDVSHRAYFNNRYLKVPRVRIPEDAFWGLDLPPQNSYEPGFI